MLRSFKALTSGNAVWKPLAACLCSVLALSAPSIGFSETGTSVEAPQRFTLDGTRLIFDSSVADEDGYDGIDYEDATELRAFLFEHPEIDLIELRSEGGVMTAALDMAAVIVDFSIDTLATGRCESACTLVFLAGENRTLERGARLGFHSTSWSRENIKDYYERMKDSHGWIDEFAFASWVYEEAMRDFNKELEFMVSRGVSVDFVIRAAYVNSDDIWYPTRDELLRYRILLQD